jgi:hypothetical protein
VDAVATAVERAAGPTRAIFAGGAAGGVSAPGRLAGALVLAVQMLRVPNALPAAAAGEADAGAGTAGAA